MFMEIVVFACTSHGIRLAKKVCVLDVWDRHYQAVLWCLRRPDDVYLCVYSKET